MNADTVKLLRRIQREIGKEPRRFYMDWWMTTRSEESPCGTAACIGGWAVILHRAEKMKVRVNRNTLPELALRTKYSDTYSDVATNARIVLGLEPGESSRLFHTEQWPHQFYSPFLRAKIGSAKAAKVAIARIEHFIKTKGEE